MSKFLSKIYIAALIYNYKLHINIHERGCIHIERKDGNIFKDWICLDCENKQFLGLS